MLLIKFLPVLCFLVGVHRNIYTGSVLDFRSKWSIFFFSCFSNSISSIKRSVIKCMSAFFVIIRSLRKPMPIVATKTFPLSNSISAFKSRHLTTLRALRRPQMSRICKYFKLSRGRISARIVEQSLFIVTSESRVHQITKRQLLTRYHKSGQFVSLWTSFSLLSKSVNFPYNMIIVLWIYFLN